MKCKEKNEWLPLGGCPFGVATNLTIDWQLNE